MRSTPRRLNRQITRAIFPATENCRADCEGYYVEFGGSAGAGISRRSNNEVGGVNVFKFIDLISKVTIVSDSSEMNNGQKHLVKRVANRK